MLSPLVVFFSVRGWNLLLVNLWTWYSDCTQVLLNIKAIKISYNTISFETKLNSSIYPKVKISSIARDVNWTIRYFNFKTLSFQNHSVDRSLLITN
jgi:hypothetical protein